MRRPRRYVWGEPGPLYKTFVKAFPYFRHPQMYTKEQKRARQYMRNYIRSSEYYRRRRSSWF